MPDRLYDLLPAVYRLRDADRGEPLRALLGIIEEELDRVEGDIAGLYDDWFIETCAEWVVPYLGDLLGVRHAPAIESAGVFSQRAFVANVLEYRQRKGTLLVLEDLARDVTGWGAHAVAFFELLGWTQHLNHVRLAAATNPYVRSRPQRTNPPDPPGVDRTYPQRTNPPAADRVGTVNLRSLDVCDRVGRAFDVTTHTVDVRPPAPPQDGQRTGWYNIRTLGVFLWRLQSYPVRAAHARRSATYADGFHFSPLGHPMPLFTNPRRRRGPSGFADETNVPAPIRPVAFFERPEDYYGVPSERDEPTEADPSLCVYRNVGVPLADLDPVPLEDVLCKDLSAWSPPPPGRVAIDVRLGRVAFAPGEAPADGITVDYHYGFSADIGGGPYDRRATLAEAGPLDFERVVAQAPLDPPNPLRRASIGAALAEWDPVAQPRAVISIADNATYEEALTLALGAGQHLILQADNRNRPHVRFTDGAGATDVLTVGGGAGEDARLTLDGLLIEGGIEVEAESLGKLDLADCTLVPGRALDEDGRAVAPGAPSLAVAAGNDRLEVEADRCIVGALRLPAEVTALTLRDGILDHPEVGAGVPRYALAADDAGDAPGPPTTLERVTVFGEVLVRTLALASESLFAHRLRAERRQAGCVRYSYVDDLVSVTPRRFRCQPDLALAERRRALDGAPVPPAEAARLRARIRPGFTSTHYGDAGYAQLDRFAAREVRTGSEGEAEVGAFEHLKQPQRAATLRLRLDEFMPFGMDAAVVYVT